MHTKTARRIVREAIGKRSAACSSQDGPQKIRVEAGFPNMVLTAACLLCLDILTKADVGIKVKAKKAKATKHTGKTGTKRVVTGEMLTRALAFHPNLAAHVAEPCTGSAVGITTVVA